MFTVKKFIGLRSYEHETRIVILHDRKAERYLKRAALLSVAHAPQTLTCQIFDEIYLEVLFSTIKREESDNV